MQDHGEEGIGGWRGAGWFAGKENWVDLWHLGFFVCSGENEEVPSFPLCKKLHFYNQYPRLYQRFTAIL